MTNLNTQQKLVVIHNCYAMPNFASAFQDEILLAMTYKPKDEEPQEVEKETRLPRIPKNRPRTFIYENVAYTGASEASRATGVPTATIWSRVRRAQSGRSENIKDQPVTVRGVTYKTYQDAADALGVALNTVYGAATAGKLERLGLSKVEKPKKEPRRVEVYGKTYKTLREAADDLGINIHTLKKRRHKGR